MDDRDDWQELLAIGLIAGDLSSLGIARYAGVPVAAATRALGAAEAAGVLTDGAVEPEAAARLIADVEPAEHGRIHALAVRHLLAQGPDRMGEALDHARAAGGVSYLAELERIATQAARTSLATGDYRAAHDLLTIANEAGVADGPQARAERLIDLAAALDGLGRIAESRTTLAMAFDLAEAAGAHDLAVSAAVAHAFPEDFLAGDPRASALLQRADALAASADERVAVTAARGIVEMRIPILPAVEAQLAWFTRPTIAQPLTEQALEASATLSPETRLTALLAWRTTHRAPRHLEARRRVSAEALDLAQLLRHPGRQVSAAAAFAVDAAEAGDRAGLDHALGVMRWIADWDGNPRLEWQARSVAAGVAFMDDDLEEAIAHRKAAAAIGSSVDLPGWPAADRVLFAQEVMQRGLLAEVAEVLPSDDNPALANPLGRSVYALGLAWLGDAAGAGRQIRIALRQIDEEASLLLLLCRIAAVVAHAGLRDLEPGVRELLEPHQDLVAVDASMWWCDGPVHQFLAQLAMLRGEYGLVSEHLDAAVPIAQGLGDARSLRRIAVHRAALPSGASGASRVVRLTDREREVLRRLVAGATNAAIARDLAYSPSTIRNDVAAIYRNLGVSNRAEAAARAIALGLV